MKSDPPRYIYRPFVVGGGGAAIRGCGRRRAPIDGERNSRWPRGSSTSPVSVIVKRKKKKSSGSTYTHTAGNKNTAGSNPMPVHWIELR